jgi:RNA polymerase sigma factor (sigma-70 family)
LQDEPSESRAGEARLESTAELLSLARQGDEAALNRLMATYVPRLTRWARGRVPPQLRSLSDTDDLVQITLLRVLKQVDGFEARRPGAFLAYLRRSLLNNLRNEIRNSARRPGGGSPADELADPGMSPLERACGRPVLQAYESALEELSENQRAAVILKIELGFSHQQIAELIGSPSANAARMLVARALVRMADLIDRRGLDGSE